MKIVGIKFQNLNSLKGEHEIRFDKPPICDSGLFAITGPTGAGKTTILDAITIALYGRVHRHDKDEPSEIMTRHTAESFSEVEFEVKGILYRAKWSNYRARKKAVGKLQGVKMELANAATGSIIISHPLAQVQQNIVDVCGLDYNQFLRSVMLCQGDFTQFLKATESQRSELLEKITDTEIYSDISSFVFQKSKDENNVLDNFRSKLDDVKLFTVDEVNAFRSNLSEKVGQESIQSTERKKVEGQFLWLKNIDKLKNKQHVLINRQEIVEETRRRNLVTFDKLKQHQKALKFKPLLVEVETNYKQVVGIKEKLSEVKLKLPDFEGETKELFEKTKQADDGYKAAVSLQKENSPIIALAERKDSLIEDINKKWLEEQEEYNTANEILIKLNADFNNKEIIVEELNKGITFLDEWISTHQVFQNLERETPVVRGYFEKVKELSQAIQNSTSKMVKYQHQKNEENNNLKQFKKNESDFDEEIEKAKEANQKFQEELKIILSGKAIEEWETGYSNLPLVINVHEQQLNFANQVIQNDVRIQQFISLEEEGAAQLEKENELLVQLKGEKQETEILFLALQKNVELQIRIEKYEGDRKALRAEQSCPLCGSTHHPYIENNYVNERNETEEKRDRQKKKVDVISGKVNEKEVFIYKLKGDIELYKNQKNQFNSEKYEAVKKFDENNEKLSEHLDISKPNVITEIIEEKKQELETVKHSIQKIRRIKKEGNDLENRITQLNEAKLRNEGVIGQTQTKIANAEEGIQRVLVELSGYSGQVTEINTKAVSLLDPYQIEFDGAAGEAIIHQLTESSQAYRNKKEEMQRKQLVLKEMETDLQKTKESIEEKTEGLKLLETKLQYIKKEKDQLQKERTTLFGEKDPSMERKRLENDLTQKKEALDKAQEALKIVEKALNIAKSQENEWTNDLKKIQETYDFLLKNLETQLKSDDILSVDILRSLFLEEKEEGQIKQILQQVEKEKTEIKQSLMDTEAELSEENEKQLTTESEEKLKTKINELDLQIAQLNQEIGRIKQILQNDEEMKTQHREISIEIERQIKEAEKWGKLSDLIGSADGKKFSRFAQGLTLARLTELANRHLEQLSDRYKILKDSTSDLRLLIVDRYQADVARPMTTLSGGESFLVSLALALGLSELASRKAQIDSLFIDEGFGTLDAETLDVAITALENLRANGKTIGIISHVEALKDRIGTQIQVNKQPGGHSNIKIMSYGMELTAS